MESYGTVNTDVGHVLYDDILWTGDRLRVQKYTEYCPQSEKEIFGNPHTLQFSCSVLKIIRVYKEGVPGGRTRSMCTLALEI